MRRITKVRFIDGGRIRLPPDKTSNGTTNISIHTIISDIDSLCDSQIFIKYFWSFY